MNSIHLILHSDRIVKTIRRIANDERQARRAAVGSPSSIKITIFEKHGNIKPWITITG